MHYFFGEAFGQSIQPVLVRDTEPRHAFTLEMSFGRSALYVFERVSHVVDLDSLD